MLSQSSVERSKEALREGHHFAARVISFYFEEDDISFRESISVFKHSTKRSETRSCRN